MIKYIKSIYLSIFFIIIHSTIFGSGNDSSLIIINNDRLINDDVFICIENSATQNISEIAQKEFSKYKDYSPDLRLKSKFIWFKFTLKNNTSTDKLFINVKQPMLETISLYEEDNGKLIKTELGNDKKFQERLVNSPNFIFPIKIDIGKSKTFYINVPISTQIKIPINITSSVFDEENNDNLFFGLYLGIMIIMIVYNLFIYVSIKEVSYLYYILYIISVALNQMVLKGYAFKFLWPNSPTIALYSPFFCAVFSGISTVLFMKDFLFLKRSYRKANQIFNIIIILYLCIFLFGFIYNKEIGYIMIEYVAAIGSLFAIYVGISLSIKKMRQAYFFIIAYLVFFIAIVLYVLGNYNLISYNFIIENVLIIASAIQVSLLSFALADKINIYREEQNKARQEALFISKENERLVTEQNINLERQVKSRTSQLIKTNDDLTNTLEKLKSAQIQLVESEKMASLGQLTAGVAHEINNPINFVVSNIKPLELDINDMCEVMNKYDNLDFNNDINKQLDEINSFKKRIDLNYIKNEIDSLLLGIKEGAQRTAEIVSNLKNFARIDQANLKYVNLNEGLESTLVLVRNTFPNDMILIKNLENIPLVECIPGKINQIFMNLITNAIHAMKEKKYENSEKETLTIKSWQEDSYVKISIKDNGIGMNEETKAKIFQPFFTTKDVGEGTGLGMSIVKGIVDSHKGEINVQTESGIGSEFIITLPIISIN